MKIDSRQSFEDKQTTHFEMGRLLFFFGQTADDFFTAMRYGFKKSFLTAEVLCATTIEQE